MGPPSSPPWIESVPHPSYLRHCEEDLSYSPDCSELFRSLFVQLNSHISEENKKKVLLIVENTSYYIDRPVVFETLTRGVSCDGCITDSVICRISFECQPFLPSQMFVAGRFTMKYVPSLDMLSIRNCLYIDKVDNYTYMAEPTISFDDTDKGLCIMTFRGNWEGQVYEDPYLVRKRKFMCNTR